jgi:hypothetical protein
LNNVVLGSGLIGLLARHMLGPSYKLIPFKKSRYYSHDIPVADTSIPYDEHTAHVLNALRLPNKSKFFPVAISYSGDLTFNKRIWAQTITDKAYKYATPHPFATTLFASDIDVHETTAKTLYDVLLDMYIDEIKSNRNIDVVSINKNTIETNNEDIIFDKLVSTIPLNALLKLCDFEDTLASADYHVFLVATDMFDLEGARRCYIGDGAIPFWKVNVLDREVFQFFSNGFVEGAETTFAMMTQKRFRILGDTVVKEAFPLGEPPTHTYKMLEELNIVPVGSNARWDYFYDVSTCIKTLSKL